MILLIDGVSDAWTKRDKEHDIESFFIVSFLPL